MYQGYQGKFWGTDSKNLCIGWEKDGLTSVLAMQKEMAQKFLRMVCRIIKKCDFLPCYERSGHDNWLLYPVTGITDIDEDDEDDKIDYNVIGCVEEADCQYLIDADFIYTELLKDCARGYTIPPKEAYFSELHRIGVIRPWHRFYRDVVCNMKIDSDVSRKWYCCIPCFLVDVDLA